MPCGVLRLHQPDPTDLTHTLFPPITFLQELRSTRQARVSPQVPFCRPAVRAGAAHVQSFSLYGAAARQPPHEIIDALPAVRTLRSTLPCLIEVIQIKAAAHPAEQPWLIKQNIPHVLTKIPCIQPTNTLIYFLLSSLQQCCFRSAPSHLCRCTRYCSFLFNDLFYSKTPVILWVSGVKPPLVVIPVLWYLTHLFFPRLVLFVSNVLFVFWWWRRKMQTSLAVSLWKTHLHVPKHQAFCQM